MSYFEAAQRITQVCPEIRNDLEHYSQNSYKLVQIFTAHIKKKISTENDIVYECLKIMSEMYRDGDETIKNAIENTFIYSLDSCTAFCSRKYRRAIFYELSEELQQIYIRQIYKHAM